jgi:Family of unknown function (DUF5829)
MRWGIAVACSFLVGACAPPSARTRTSPSNQIAHLNHFYATVDAETAAAIRDSAFVKRFANLEVRTTQGTTSTWTGTYLYGRQTYVEFFGPDDFQIAGKPAPVGSWGIGVSGDRPGHVAELKSRLEAVGLEAVVELDTRTFGERKVPWFSALTALSRHGNSGGIDDVVSAWAMEYAPSYFDLPEAAKEPAEGAEDIISRERYQSDLYQQRMMRDVTRVELDVGAKDFARIEPLLTAAGFRIRQSGSRVVADGEETDFVFHLTGQMGLRRVEFSLNAPLASEVHIIGKSRLSVGPGGTAVWIFN